MTREIISRFPSELVDTLEFELKRKYAPFKPPSRNSVLMQLVKTYVEELRKENEAAGR